MKRTVLLVTSLLATGCFRFSDPVYSYQDIAAEEPRDPGESLIFGTILAGDAVFLSELSTVTLKQVAPEVPVPYRYVTTNNLFRVFAPRTVKDGHFVIHVPPGVYQFESMSTSSWLSKPVIFHLTDDAAVKSRIYITRPGIYDIGVIKIEAPKGWFGSYSMDWSSPGLTAERRKVLETAIRGTGWARYQPE